MEDIQDGIKVSIQDGVEEDPEAEAKEEIGGKSFLGVLAIKKEISCPTTSTSLETSTDSEDFMATTTTILGTSVV